MSDNGKEEVKKEGKMASDTMAVFFTLSSGIDAVRKCVKLAFADSDPDCMDNAKYALMAARAGLAAGGVSFESVKASLPTEQMREDLSDALATTMAIKSPAVVAAGMLYLKGIIIPLAEDLKNARQTIENLMVATGKKESEA